MLSSHEDTWDTWDMPNINKFKIKDVSKRKIDSIQGRETRRWGINNVCYLLILPFYSIINYLWERVEKGRDLKLFIEKV